METCNNDLKDIQIRFEEHLQKLTTDRNIPPFVDLPPQSGKCPFTGLRRGLLQTLPQASGGLVRILRLSNPGSRRGKLLVDLPRLLAYLKANEDLQDSGGVH